MRHLTFPTDGLSSLQRGSHFAPVYPPSPAGYTQGRLAVSAITVENHRILNSHPQPIRLLLIIPGDQSHNRRRQLCRSLVAERVENRVSTDADIASMNGIRVKHRHSFSQPMPNLPTQFAFQIAKFQREFTNVSGDCCRNGIDPTAFSAQNTNDIRR